MAPIALDLSVTETNIVWMISVLVMAFSAMVILAISCGCCQGSQKDKNQKVPYVEPIFSPAPMPPVEETNSPEPPPMEVPPITPSPINQKEPASKMESKQQQPALASLKMAPKQESPASVPTAPVKTQQTNGKTTQPSSPTRKDRSGRGAVSTAKQAPGKTAPTKSAKFPSLPPPPSYSMVFQSPPSSPHGGSLVASIVTAPEPMDKAGMAKPVKPVYGYPENETVPHCDPAYMTIGLDMDNPFQPAQPKKTTPSIAAKLAEPPRKTKQPKPAPGEKLPKTGKDRSVTATQKAEKTAKKSVSMRQGDSIRSIQFSQTNPILPPTDDD